MTCGLDFDDIPLTHSPKLSGTQNATPHEARALIQYTSENPSENPSKNPPERITKKGYLQYGRNNSDSIGF